MSESNDQQSRHLLATVCNLAERSSLIAVELKKFLNDGLIESKKGSLKNENCVAQMDDFKTFADVLIQQVISRGIELEFPQLGGGKAVFGEESNKIEVDGLCVEVKLCATDDLEDVRTTTFPCLVSVLGSQNESLCWRLCDIIHKQGLYKEDAWSYEYFPEQFYVDISGLGFWIDPIDCTDQYIKATFNEDEVLVNDEMKHDGLACVTCLIGAFDVHSGSPLFGFITQPFVKSSIGIKPSPSPSSIPAVISGCELFWGINTDQFKGTNIPDWFLNKGHVGPSPGSNKDLIAVRSTTTDILTEAVDSNFNCVRARGAGYKCLSAILGFSYFFINMSGGTYYWDLCAPNAIICALGGNIVTMKHFMQTCWDQNESPSSLSFLANDQLSVACSQTPIVYKVPTEFPLKDISECCLKDGFCVSRNVSNVIHILRQAYLKTTAHTSSVCNN